MSVKTKRLHEVPALDKATEQTNLLVEHDGLAGRLPVAFSQGRSANITLTKPGWKRILNVIRAHSGSLNLGIGKANAADGYAFQALGLEFTGNVNFPGTKDVPIAFKSTPVIYQKYNHMMGENLDDDENRTAKITKVRIGYPKQEYKTSPVNCYVDVYAEFTCGTPALLVNYAGFAVSHNCASITDEVEATATGMYGEELEFFEFEPNPAYALCMPENNIKAKEVTCQHTSAGSVEALQSTVDDFRATEAIIKQLYADNMPFEKIVGTTNNPIVLRNLTKNGTYYLSGKFKHHETDKVSSLVEGFYIVKWTKDASYIVRHSASDTGIRYYTIQDDSYTAKQFNHADITTALEKISALEKRVEALDGKVEEYHLPVFYIDGVEYKFEQGMTLLNWLDSKYNTGGWYLTEFDYSYLTTEELDAQWKGVRIIEDLIEEGHKYTSDTYSEYNYFTVDGTTYGGMRFNTWNDWINSEENKALAPFFSYSGDFVDYEGLYVWDENDNIQRTYDEIVRGGEYHLAYGHEKDLIWFTLDGGRYPAKSGMTWEEWVNSNYHTCEPPMNIDIYEGRPDIEGECIFNSENEKQLATDIIADDGEYFSAFDYELEEE